MSKKKSVDPYATLDVTRNADKDTIKRSYRKKVKGAHPDTGGTPKKFHQLQLCYEVLMNDERRAKFDQTGEIDEEDTVDNTITDAMSAISAVMKAIVVEQVQMGGKPECFDLVALIRNKLRQELVSREEGVKPLVSGVASLKEICERFKFRKEGPNRLAEIARFHYDQARFMLDKEETEIAGRKKALELIEEYSFAPRQRTYEDMSPQQKKKQRIYDALGFKP